jgi:hypothetical protein
MRARPALTAVLTTALLTLGACSDDSPEPSAVESATGSPSEATSSAAPSDMPSEKPSGKPTKSAPIGTTIKVTIQGGKVTPNGSRVKVKVGEPVTLQIDADTEGEIHVHSTPEQEIEFDAGKSMKKLTINQPGIVDVEDHELEQVIVQLEAS